MDKLENLKQLKQLFDDGILSEKEFSEMKNEILTKNDNEIITSKNLYENIRKEVKQVNNGFLTVSFAGQWFLFDAKTRVFVNSDLHSTHSTKNGFSLKIPIESDCISLRLEINELESTTFEIEDLDIKKNYTMLVEYSRIWGKYSSKFNFSENG
jgi:hypothetical protein